MNMVTKITHHVDLDETLWFYTDDPHGVRDEEVRAERLELSNSSSVLAKGPQVNKDNTRGPLTLAIYIDLDELPQPVAVAVLEQLLNA